MTENLAQAIRRGEITLDQARAQARQQRETKLDELDRAAREIAAQRVELERAKAQDNEVELVRAHAARRLEDLVQGATVEAISVEHGASGTMANRLCLTFSNGRTLSVGVGHIDYDVVTLDARCDGEQLLGKQV